MFDAGIIQLTQGEISVSEATLRARLPMLFEDESIRAALKCCVRIEVARIALRLGAFTSWVGEAGMEAGRVLQRAVDEAALTLETALDLALQWRILDEVGERLPGSVSSREPWLRTHHVRVRVENVEACLVKLERPARAIVVASRALDRLQALHVEGYQRERKRKELEAYQAEEEEEYIRDLGVRVNEEADPASWAKATAELERRAAALDASRERIAHKTRQIENVRTKAVESLRDALQGLEALEDASQGASEVDLELFESSEFGCRLRKVFDVERVARYTAHDGEGERRAWKRARRREVLLGAARMLLFAALGSGVVVGGVLLRRRPWKELEIVDVERRPPTGLELHAYKEALLGHPFLKRWDPLESTCRHASLSIL